PGPAVTLASHPGRGVELGSFYDVHQPDVQEVATLHASQGRSGSKDEYCPLIPPAGSQQARCAFNPGVRTFPIAVYFEATSRWDSQYDGLLINVNRRLTRNFSYALG